MSTLKIMLLIGASPLVLLFAYNIIFSFTKKGKEKQRLRNERIKQLIEQDEIKKREELEKKRRRRKKKTRGSEAVGNRGRREKEAIRGRAERERAKR